MTRGPRWAPEAQMRLLALQSAHDIEARPGSEGGHTHALTQRGCRGASSFEKKDPNWQRRGQALMGRHSLAPVFTTASLKTDRASAFQSERRVWQA